MVKNSNHSSTSIVGRFISNWALELPPLIRFFHTADSSTLHTDPNEQKSFIIDHNKRQSAKTTRHTDNWRPKRKHFILQGFNFIDKFHDQSVLSTFSIFCTHFGQLFVCSLLCLASNDVIAIIVLSFSKMAGDYSQKWPRLMLNGFFLRSWKQYTAKWKMIADKSKHLSLLSPSESITNK